MKKVLIAFMSATGKTEKMAGFIAEGVRFGGHQAVVKKVTDIKKPADLGGYDGYIFGSPTFSLDIPGPMKSFLEMAQKAGLKGKPAGAFGTYKHDVGYRHDTHAAGMIYGAMEGMGMLPFELGAFNLQEDVIDTSQGMETCQDYGRVFGQKI